MTSALPLQPAPETRVCSGAWLTEEYRQSIERIGARLAFAGFGTARAILEALAAASAASFASAMEIFAFDEFGLCLGIFSIVPKSKMAGLPQSLCARKDRRHRVLRSRSSRTS
jgi:hypothetical protein